ncbi:hypothetical protein WMY93_002603 [Mugilogobius chulae]|uniref:Uncharacterized protein n=1 Tax=Mugilogobius chulae TaxID=88201 RepID=A0AAW0Q436_9GOBI
MASEYKGGHMTWHRRCCYRGPCSFFPLTLGVLQLAHNAAVLISQLPSRTLPHSWALSMELTPGRGQKTLQACPKSTCGSEGLQMGLCVPSQTLAQFRRTEGRSSAE